MSLKKIDPATLEFAPIGTNVSRHIKTPGLRQRVLEKFNDEGMMNSIVVSDSPHLGVGCGRFAPGSCTSEEVPVIYEEVLSVIEGSVSLTSDGKKETAKAGEFFHITPGTKVQFSSEEGCLLLFVTTPPPWVAFEKALLEGRIK